MDALMLLLSALAGLCLGVLATCWRLGGGWAGMLAALRTMRTGGQGEEQ